MREKPCNHSMWPRHAVLEASTACMLELAAGLPDGESKHVALVDGVGQHDVAEPRSLRYAASINREP